MNMPRHSLHDPDRNVPGIREWLALVLTVWGLLVCRQAGAVGSWIPLLNKPPGTNAGHMLLLSVAVASSSEVFSLQVVANGNASDPVPFDALAVWVDFNYLGSLQLGSYSNPYKTLSNGVSAVSKGGTIAFKAIVQPSISHETMTISKPMTLISVGGPATVGQK